MRRVVLGFVVLAGLACFTLGSAPTRTDRLVRKIQVALTFANCAAEGASGLCVASAGGALSVEGTSPGDGEPANGDDRYRLFTVVGGQVKARYNASGLIAGVEETKVARISVVADGLTYSTPAATGTARIQIAPATNAGVLIGNRFLLGGVHVLAVSTQ